MSVTTILAKVFKHNKHDECIKMHWKLRACVFNFASIIRPSLKAQKALRVPHCLYVIDWLTLAWYILTHSSYWRTQSGALERKCLSNCTLLLYLNNILEYLYFTISSTKTYFFFFTFSFRSSDCLLYLKRQLFFSHDQSNSCESEFIAFIKSLD